MTSIKLKFRPSALSDGGEGTLFFQVTRFRVTRTICTDFHIRQDEWNDKHSIVRITGDPERQERLRLISSQVEWSLKQLMRLAVEREKAEMDYSADDIVMAYRRLPALPTWFGFRMKPSIELVEQARAMRSLLVAVKSSAIMSVREISLCAFS